MNYNFGFFEIHILTQPISFYISKSNEADGYLKNKNWYYCGWDYGALNYGAILISVAVNIFLICITACVTKSKIKKIK